VDAVEDALQAGFRAGLSAAQTLDTTLYLLRLACRGAMQRELGHGWWAERFARERTLHPQAHYTDDQPEAEVNQAEALRNWIKANDRRFKREKRRKGGADG